MKKGLKITESHYLHMEQIVEWWIRSDGTLIIETASTDSGTITIVPDSSEPLGSYTDKVSVSELHRIKREINEYMEITQQERLASVKKLI